MDLQDPATIVIVQIGKIGDMILTTPLFSGIKDIFPESNIIVLASRINKDIPLNHISVNEVIIYNKSILKNLMLLNTSLMKADLWIDTKNNYSRTSELLVKIFKPKLTFGYNYDKKIFDIPLNDHLTGEHAVDINLSPVNLLNKTKELVSKKPAFNIPSGIQTKVRSAMQINPDLKKVIINISAGDKSRYIQKEKWVSIINNINDPAKFFLYIIGLKKDSDTIDYILQNTESSNIKYLKSEDIIETSEIVKRSDYVITADTSIVHICSAFNIPVVAVYPDVKWNLVKFAPLSDIKEIIVSGSKDSVDDVKSDEITEGFKKIVTRGNAESRTRVRKEDH